MNEIDRIKDQLSRAHSGPAWHGPSVREVLTGVPPHVAMRRPISEAHTIWEIALHILAWQESVLTRTKGLPLQLTPEEDWPQPEMPDPASWSRVLERLDLSHQALMGALSALKNESLDEMVPGESYTLYFMLHGLIQHNLFHAGQIAVLKKHRQSA